MVNVSDREVQINNFGENFAAGLRQTFNASGLDDIFSIPTDGAAQGRISGEILFALGQGLNIGQRADTGDTVWDAYSGTLTIRLRGGRLYDGPSITPQVLSEFNARAARINAIMQIQGQGLAVTIRGPFDTGNLPFYSVKYIRPQGITPYTDWDYLQDVIEMVYGVEFSILASAWA